MIFGLVMLFLWVSSIIGWVIYNLYTKNVKLENTVLAQATFIVNLQALIEQSEKATKALDDKIWLDSDKDLLTVFQNLKEIQEKLNQFNRKTL
jgi:hypothetical protein